MANVTINGVTFIPGNGYMNLSLSGQCKFNIYRFVEEDGDRLIFKGLSFPGEELRLFAFPKTHNFVLYDSVDVGVGDALRDESSCLDGRRLEGEDDIVVVKRGREVLYKGMDDYNPMKDGDWDWSAAKGLYELKSDRRVTMKVLDSLVAEDSITEDATQLYLKGSMGEYEPVEIVSKEGDGAFHKVVIRHKNGKTETTIWNRLTSKHPLDCKTNEVTDGQIVGGEGRSMESIPYGLYQEGGRSYRGFEITSSENGLRKGVYRFYNLGGGGVPFGNSAVDGQFSEAQFQKLIGEGKVKLLDSVGYFGDAGDFEDSMMNDFYNKFEKETDIDFLTESLSEMRRYERNWNYEGKKNAGCTLPELRQLIKFAEKRLQELKNKKDSILKDSEPRYRVTAIFKKPFNWYEDALKDSSTVEYVIKTAYFGDNYGYLYLSKRGPGRSGRSWGRSWVEKDSSEIDKFSSRESAEKIAKETQPKYKAYVVPYKKDSMMNDAAVNCNKFEMLAKESGANFHNISNTKKDGVTYMKFVSSAPEAEQERAVNWLRSVLEGQEGSGVLSWGMRGTYRGEMAVMIKDAEISHNDSIKEHDGDLKDSSLSWYFDVPTRAQVMAMSSSELSRLKSNLATAKRQIPFSNKAAWNKIRSLSGWIKSREEKKDSKMFKVVDKATGKTLLVKATDSMAAVQRVSALRDAAWTVTARTNDFEFGNNLGAIINANSAEEAIEKFRQILVRRGDKINHIHARLANEEDRRKGIKEYNDASEPTFKFAGKDIPKSRYEADLYWMKFGGTGVLQYSLKTKSGQITTSHPYDETEYHWAKSTDGRRWDIIYKGSIAGSFSGDAEAVLKELVGRDKAKNLGRKGGIW